jgi:hypothetical protein
MHDLSVDLQALPPDASLGCRAFAGVAPRRARGLSIRRELLVALYIAVATLIAGVGLR